MPSFTSSAEVFAYLDSFVNTTGAAVPRTLRHERLAVMAEAAGHPERCADVFHIAGSKGKGSVTGILTSILSAAGERASQYASPHVYDPRERITLGKNYLDEELYAKCGDELRALQEALSDKSRDEFKLFHGDYPPAYFELLTFYYFFCARAAKASFMTVETGMGGRFDPTNVVTPLASLITVIELEHTAILGNTIEEIAFEKAGIIKENTPVFIAEQEDDALRVFVEAAKKKNAPLYYLPHIASLENIKLDYNGCSFTIVPKKSAFFDKPLNLSIRISCAAQASNAALAVLALKAVSPNISEDAVRKGLMTFSLPARFEKLETTPPLVIDGAHTPLSVRQTCESWTALYGDSGVLLFGCAADKNAALMAEALVPHFSGIVITAPGYYKAGDSAGVYALFKAEAEKRRLQPEIIHIPDTSNAVNKALEMSKKNNLPLFCTGSFYLAAEARAQSRVLRRRSGILA